jgi:hypothetical protein
LPHQQNWVKTVNCNLVWTAERVGGTLKLIQRKGEGQGANIRADLSANKYRKDSEDWEQESDKLLPEAGKVVDHRAHLLSQRTAESFALQNWKTNSKL